MGDIRNKIRQQYLDKVAGKTVEYKVEEWDVNVLIVPANLATQAKISRYTDSEDTLNALVTLIIDCVKTEDGSPMFSEEDRVMLCEEADPEVVSALGNKVAESLSDVGEAGKN